MPTRSAADERGWASLGRMALGSGWASHCHGCCVLQPVASRHQGGVCRSIPMTPGVTGLQLVRKKVQHCYCVTFGTTNCIVNDSWPLHMASSMMKPLTHLKTSSARFRHHDVDISCKFQRIKNVLKSPSLSANVKLIKNKAWRQFLSEL